MSTEEYFEHMDVAKAIAIFLVVLGHLINQQMNFLIAYIATCHMPLFFFVSGFFLCKSMEGRSKRQLLSKKVRALLLPFFIWSTVAALVDVLLLYLQGSTWEQILKEAYSIFLGARGVWFLIILFFSQLIVILCMNTAKAIESLILISIVYLTICLFAPNEFLSLFKFKWLFPFLVMGFFFYLYKAKLGFILILKNKRILTIIKLLSVVVLPVLIWLFYRKNSFLMYFNFNPVTVYDVLSILPYYALSLMGIVNILTLSKDLCKKPFHKELCLVGKTSIDIYLIHMLLIKIILHLCSTQCDSYIWRYLYAPIIAVLLVVSITIISQNKLRKMAIYRKALGIYRS